MLAHVLAIMHVTDPIGCEQYEERAAFSVAGYAGRYFARVGDFEILEGDPDANRVAVLEFDGFEKARD